MQALYIYTLETEIYRDMNQAMRSPDLRGIAHWRPARRRVRTAPPPLSNPPGCLPPPSLRGGPTFFVIPKRGAEEGGNRHLGGGDRHPRWNREGG